MKTVYRVINGSIVSATPRKISEGRRVYFDRCELTGFRAVVFREEYEAMATSPQEAIDQSRSALQTKAEEINNLLVRLDILEKDLIKMITNEPEKYIIYPPFTGYLINLSNDLIVGDPQKLPIDTDWGQWQNALRFAAFRNQKYTCPVCSGPLHLNGQKGELHHALISRENVRGVYRSFKQLIHRTYNCILLHSECHNINRQDGWNILTKLYGKEAIIEWYEGLPEQILRMDWRTWEED